MPTPDASLHSYTYMHTRRCVHAREKEEVELDSNLTQLHIYIYIP